MDDQQRMDGEDVCRKADQLILAEQEVLEADDAVSRCQSALRQAQRAARESRWKRDLLRSRYLRVRDQERKKR